MRIRATKNKICIGYFFCHAGQQNAIMNCSHFDTGINSLRKPGSNFNLRSFDVRLRRPNEPVKIGSLNHVRINK
jgi:hypothetical protein